jgi:hypothetical protein
MEYPGVRLEEIMVLRLGGHIMAWYSEWRALRGGQRILAC